MNRRYETLATTPAPFACLSCRDSKRRCDRAIPQCKGCIQKRIACDYPYRRKRRERKRLVGNIVVSPISNLLTDRSSLSASAETSQASPDYDSLHLAPPNSTGAKFLTERFLDPEAFSSAQLKVPEPDVDYLVTRDVSDLVGDVSNIKATCDEFFTSVHEWMPIVSKIQFMASLVSWLTYKRAELFFLILAMKLSCEQGSGPRTPLYQVTKHLQFRIENSGVLSLQVTQASVLISIYEMGHGIYPAAFLSIAACARYAAALGIDKSILGHNVMGIPWNELEERRRVWWSILVLDRFLNLSDPSRHLVTPDPILENWLPVDDAAFNDGTSRPEDAFTLGSANALVLGRFARFAQAAHLLGQVLRHVAEGSTESETAQLRRTIFSLVSVSKMEAHLRQLEFCSQTAVCYCGILLLDCSQAKRRDGAESPAISLHQLSTESNLISQTALQISVYIAQRADLEIHSRSSPFLLHMLYRVALVYLKASRSTPGDSITDKLHVVKRGLEILGRRWRVAQSYLSLLSRCEIMQAMQ
ncbi:N-terminal binuclear Zn cluster-containing protein [Trichoderma ceciliae]